MKYKIGKDLEVTREDSLLLLAARTEINEEIKSEMVSILKQEIDWDYLIKRSKDHKLTPLLYWNLNKVSPDLIPPEIMEDLKVYFNINAHRNLFFMGELLRILELFESYEIYAIPYKGPILAALTYDNLALREFDDLDIFIWRKNIKKAKNLMLSKGYKMFSKPKGIREYFYLKSQRDFQFYNPDNHINIELHWNFIGLTFSSQNDLFKDPKNLININVQKKKVLTLSSEDMLLILCIHASGHQWERLSWICDINEFIRSNRDIDWQNLIKKAELLGFKRILQINIYLAKDLFDLRIEDKFMNQLDIDKSLKNFYSDIRRNILVNNENENSVLNKALFRFKIRERKSDKIEDFSKTLISQYILSLHQFLNRH